MPASDESNELSASSGAGNPAQTPRVYDSDELFAGQKEIWIMHGDMMYRLKITSANKLVLHK
jgi:hemin uptake protein HemP